MFPISRTVYLGEISSGRIHQLATPRQRVDIKRVDITCSWTPATQPIWLGLLYLRSGAFYSYERYDGYAEVSIYPPSSDYYTIGVFNPPWNKDPINCNGQYVLNP